MKPALEIPEWKLERYLLGELPAGEMEEVRIAADSDAAIKARLIEIEGSTRAFLDQHPPDRMAGSILVRVRRAGAEPECHAPPLRVLRLLPALALTGAAVALVWFSLPYFRVSNPSVTESQEIETDTRIKGVHPYLFLYRRTASGSDRLSEGSITRRGDLIQLAYQVSEPSFGVILSIDGGGAVTLHMPQQVGMSPQLAPGRMIPLDVSYQLDDAPDYERFYLITSLKAFDIQPIMEAAQSAAAGRSATGPAILQLPATYSRYDITVRKGH
ncbi:MAG: hypothetical protein AB1714_02170 [Acidobacteriota bacterium]